MLVILLILISCKVSQNVIYKRQMKESFLYTFKLEYFKKLLIKIYNNTDAINSILSQDNSGYSEELLTISDYAIIDTFSTIDNYKITQDSIDRIGRVAEGAQGKHILSFVLYKFNSKWLDSLAKARYKIYYRESLKNE